jgi:hypothetical protein
LDDTVVTGLEDTLPMSLLTQLIEKKPTITEKWFEMVISSYAAETAKFLKGQKDPFANPVGQNTRKNLDLLFDLLSLPFDETRIEAALDPIIRIRAIQNFTPAQATRFVFGLKQVIRDWLPLKDSDTRLMNEMADLDRRIDEFGLAAFNVYMRCREKIYELQANEMKSRTLRAFARAGLVKEPEDDG